MVAIGLQQRIELNLAENGWAGSDRESEKDERRHTVVPVFHAYTKIIHFAIGTRS